MKVLVVDDNMIDRMMLSKVLESNKYEVFEAENGIEALKIISSKEPDIVISDIMMPEMDGYSLLREIRKTKTAKELPFVFYSASYVTEKDRELAKALGVSRFIVKPIEPRQLLKEITQSLIDFSKGELEIVETTIDDDKYLEQYSRRLFKKLQEQVKQLEQEIDERKRIEAALSESETKFRAMFENAPIGMVRADMEGRPLETNRVFQQMIGYNDGELRNMVSTEFTHPDDVELDMDLYKEIKAGKRNKFMIKKRFIRKNGTNFWGILTVSLVRDGSGKPMFSIYMIEDITERKEAEEKLQQSEEKYRSLIDNMQDGVFIIQDGKLQFVNEAFARVSGYTFEELIGSDFRNFIAPEDRLRVAEFYARRQAGENIPGEYEFNALSSDRKTRINVIINVGLINYRKRVATMGTLKDITERKRAELLLRQSKEFSETVLNSINDSISIVNVKDFAIIDANKAFLDNYELKKEQVIGKQCYKITHKIDHPCHFPEICPLTMTHETGKASICEHEHILNNGVIQYVEVSAYPIRNESGEIVSVVHVARDISQRKEAEKLLKEKARAELYGFIVSALPVFASGVPSQVRDVLIKNFSERFERNVKPRFKDEMKEIVQNMDRLQLLEAYLGWLSGLFANFGIENRKIKSDKKEGLELINCPWINEARGNPIFCFICRSLAKRSFTWTGLKGGIEQRSSIASNSKTCRFEIRMQEETSQEA